MRCLIILLLVFVSVASAQPLPDPYRVIQASGYITAPQITVRDSSTADVFYIWEDANNAQYAQHAVTSLTAHSLITGPETLQHTDNWSQQIGDVVSRGDSGWLAILYEREQNLGTLYPYTTRLMHGRSGTFQTSVLDTGHWVEGVMPGILCNWIHDNVAFRLRPNRSGGWLASWVREGCWNLSGNFSEPDNWPQMVRVNANAVVVGSESGCGAYNGYITDGLWCPLSADSVIGLSLNADMNYSGTFPVVMCMFPTEEPGPPVQIPCSTVVVDLQATRGGRLLLLTGATMYSPIRPAAFRELLRDGSWGEVHPLTIPRFDAVAYHPDYGFAVLSVMDHQQILLSRIDTLGAEYPGGRTFYQAPGGRALDQADLTISDDGRVSVVWTERDDDVVNANEIFAGYIRWDTELSIDPPSSGLLPSSFSLSAYPNPFNGETTLHYTLLQSGIVELAVYNVLGQQVSILTSGMKPAGNYAATWSPTGAGGLYFAVLKSGGQTRITKMVYLK
jgi:hypothetical protein